MITEAAARDEDLGILKSGKEAEVFLVERTLGERSSLLAAKRYLGTDRSSFRRNATYLEGRQARDRRMQRAMDLRSRAGALAAAETWARAEMQALTTLWSAGVAVPYPVQLLGTELMLEFIGDEDGAAAPRLAEIRPDRDEARELFDQVVALLVGMVGAGLVHADLSPYNLLVHEGRVIAIDLPQAADLVLNPHGFDFLRRDVENVCAWFARRGVAADAVALYEDLAVAAVTD